MTPDERQAFKRLQDSVAILSICSLLQAVALISFMLRWMLG